ncbi:hypothetical protein A6770_37885 [Nostoc minutum NIES-26]|uniref:Filamentous haemagglutinin FhaB/tRNA nuclease CdiA-like TPS domain-containing protein n=1 Tax=Nostoc minutum NIES-26 TaxID=1844469 RepID=A0A367RVD5_9NOSO|nr:hypothetical protein A6770_37885 [Nostoc minutum NIES-26]
MSVPIGLRLDNNPGEIRVQGSGHNLVISSLFSPVLGAGASSNGLRILPKKTLALIGGNIALEGGNLTAPGGQIELGSVNDGTVSINPTTSGWEFGYKGLQNFQNIEMSKRALVDTSGFGNSAIQLVGKQIVLTEGSVALIQNQGAQAASGVNMQASMLLRLSGTSPDGMIPSGVEVETLGGNVGDVVVSTKHLSFEDGAAINSKTFTQASASNIFLNASESIEVKGFSFINPTAASIASGVGSYTFSAGTSGKIAINTGQLTVLDGGTITSGTFGAGTGGELIVNANRSVELSGFNPILSSPSQVAVGAYYSGNSGNLKFISPTIRLYNGGLIASYTFSSGSAGNVTIEAPNFIDITTPTNIENLSYSFPSGISSYAVTPPLPIQKLLNLSSEVSGEASSIKIKTGQLSLSKGSITVSNAGTGSAGNVDVNANIISLQNNSSISAATALGNGGNIFLHANNVQLFGKSTISASATNPLVAIRLLNINAPYKLTVTGSGNGGNIDINTIFLIASQNGQITADAFKGRGGNIYINTQGLFITPDTQITSNSQLGIDGTVEIDFQDRNPSQVKVQPEAIAQTPEIASICPGRSGAIAGKFVFRGRESALFELNKPLYNQSFLESSFVPVEENKPLAKTRSSTIEENTQIVEAQGWVLDSNGQVTLVATKPNEVTPNSSLNSSSCSSVTPVSQLFPSIETSYSDD